jgi:hypothetical protein
MESNPDTTEGGLESHYIEASGPTALSKNTWHHVAFTYKYPGGVKLYVDGRMVASTKNSASDLGYIQRGVQPLYIGWFDYFRGMIDEVSVYPKCLSPQQIYQDYTQSKSGQSSSSKMVANETSSGNQIRCEVIPNDGHADGTALSTRTVKIAPSGQSSTLTIQTTSTDKANILLGNHSYDENTTTSAAPKANIGMHTDRILLGSPEMVGNSPWTAAMNSNHNLTALALGRVADSVMLNSGVSTSERHKWLLSAKG